MGISGLHGRCPAQGREAFPQGNIGWPNVMLSADMSETLQWTVFFASAAMTGRQGGVRVCANGTQRDSGRTRP